MGIRGLTRVLVTGGTGYIGGALLRHLMRSEVDATALVHDKARSFLLPREVEFHTIDELEDSGTGFDAVVYLGYGTALGRKETLTRNRDFADKVLRLAGIVSTPEWITSGACRDTTTMTPTPT